MAEYLCEEDMNTGEYISRDLALKQLNATCLATDCDNYNGVRCRACAYADAMDFIDAIPAADVQPINRWIKADESLPVYGGMVLICDKSKNIRLGIYTDMGWCSQFGNPMMCKITHWQPLPEPPKDGDTNG